MEKENKTRAHVFVEGEVQGVFFRANTRKQARRRGVEGWVRNLDDGRVEAVLEGERGRVKEVVDWMRKGPWAAEVKNLEASFKEPEEEFERFEIRY